ncbi:UDP-glucose:glycoprotein glucosyltransferase-like [Cornus florida]|uniref:UDP-glucose:glycoprotein glucosyltransferase-like n=1 Tax=Cornus florida TaxID=4283 RepID=UPI0028A01201|nr:UDP-glucose:glycoprotein glucosyltransferase-like [Cornus florida]
MPVFPEQLRYIRKNLFHTVFVVDSTFIYGLEAIDTIISLYENSFPMRFGVILYSTKFIKKIESNNGELPLDPVENDSGTEEDVSSLIKDHTLIHHRHIQRFMDYSRVGCTRFLYPTTKETT